MKLMNRLSDRTMRTETEMMALILDTSHEDQRILGKSSTPCRCWMESCASS